MNAKVLEPHSVTCCSKEGEKFNINYPVILKSYASDVAVYDECANRVYLLPDYDYSNTTCKHMHAFIEDYTPFPFESYNTIRKDAKGAKRKYMFIKNVSY